MGLGVYKSVWVSISFGFHSLTTSNILAICNIWLAAISLQLSTVFTQCSLVEQNRSSTWLGDFIGKTKLAAHSVVIKRVGHYHIILSYSTGSWCVVHYDSHCII